MATDDLTRTASDPGAAIVNGEQPAGEKNTVNKYSTPARSLSNRTALIIGNADYAYSSKLKNPVNDAQDISVLLRKFGFEVLYEENSSKASMEDAVRRLSNKVSGGVGLFFYAGHAMQINGRNFLIPTSDEPRSEDEVGYKALDAEFVLEKLGRSGSRLNIIILDACRNNPFSRGRPIGLVPMTTTGETLLAYSTAPNATASDGGIDRNGLYTKHLLEVIPTPGLPVESVFKEVRRRVREESRGRQIPWEHTSMTEDFFFAPGSDISNRVVVIRAPPAALSPLEEKQGLLKKRIAISLHEAKGRNFSIQPLVDIFNSHGYGILDDRYGADYLLEGEITVTSGSSIAGTSLRPRYVDLDIVIRSRVDGNIIKYLNVQGVSPHLDEFQGAKIALKKAIAQHRATLVDFP